MIVHVVLWCTVWCYMMLYRAVWCRVVPYVVLCGAIVSCGDMRGAMWSIRVVW